MYRNTNYFAPWSILVLKQMGLELVPFYSGHRIVQIPIQQPLTSTHAWLWLAHAD